MSAHTRTDTTVLPWGWRTTDMHRRWRAERDVGKGRCWIRFGVGIGIGIGMDVELQGREEEQLRGRSAQRIGRGRAVSDRSPARSRAQLLQRPRARAPRTPRARACDAVRQSGAGRARAGAVRGSVAVSRLSQACDPGPAPSAVVVKRGSRLCLRRLRVSEARSWQAAQAFR
eukprot:3937782-Rhodomonas_salina.1